MLRSTASKVLWVGRATVFLVGLAVILAVVLGAATTALSATGGNFILGQSNSADAPTTLAWTGNTDITKSALVLKNIKGGNALKLVVGDGIAPLKVNSDAKVANLNADKLDGRDSRTLGVTTATNQERTGPRSANPPGCTTTLIANRCAVVTVKVPAGKRYHLTVFSSLAVKSASSTSVDYCPFIDASTSAGFIGCLGSHNTISLAANYAESAANSGQIILGPGTYPVGTLVGTGSAALISDPGLNAETTVLVRDATALGPPIN